MMLYDPVRKMPQYYNSFQQSVGASQEIFGFIDAQDEVPEKKKAAVLKGFSRAVEFKQVRFAYDREGQAPRRAAWDLGEPALR